MLEPRPLRIKPSFKKFLTSWRAYLVQKQLCIITHGQWRAVTDQWKGYLWKPYLEKVTVETCN